MLVGIEGGGSQRSIREVLSRFAEERMRGGGSLAESRPPSDPSLFAAALDICERFFDALEPAARGESSRSGRGRPPRISARFVERLAGCYVLFPYQCLAASPLVATFRRELPLLASWGVSQGFCGEEGRSPFDAVEGDAAAALSRHAALQRACEGALERLPAGTREGGRLVIDGRFRIARTPRSAGACGEGDLLTATVPRGASYGPLLFPQSWSDLFRPGDDVCLALVESAAGWVAVSSNLPVAPAEIEALASRWLEGSRTAGPGRFPADVARVSPPRR